MWRTNENVHAFRHIHAMYAFKNEYYLDVLFSQSMLINAKG